MVLPGITDEQELKLLLKKLIENKDETFKFAVVASGPKEGELILNKKEKLKKRDVQAAAEAEAKAKSGGKPVKLDVITGECRLDAAGSTTLRLIVYGKAIAKAVACIEHLLVRGPFKTIGFTAVLLEEVEEPVEGGPASANSVATPNTTSTTPEVTDNSAALAQKTKLAEALKQIRPLLDKSVDRHPERKVELFGFVGQIAGELKDNKLSDAQTHLVALTKLLQTLAAPADTAPGNADLQVRFNTAKSQLEPQVLAAQRTHPDKGTALLNLWNFALDQAAADNYNSALTALDKLQAALAKLAAESAPSSATVRSDDVASNSTLEADYQRAKIKFAAARGTWTKISDQAVRTIRSIRDAMYDEFKDDPELADNLTRGVQQLDAVALRFNDDLKRKFEEFIAEPPPPVTARDVIRREALELIASYRSELDANPIYHALDQQEFSQELVKAPIMQALAGIASDLA